MWLRIKHGTIWSILQKAIKQRQPQTWAILEIQVFKHFCSLLVHSRKAMFFIKWWTFTEVIKIACLGQAPLGVLWANTGEVSHKFNTTNKKRNPKFASWTCTQPSAKISLTAEPPVAPAETWSSVFLATCSSLLLNFLPSSQHPDLCKQQPLHKCHRKRDVPRWTSVRGADAWKQKPPPSASD